MRFNKQVDNYGKIFRKTKIDFGQIGFYIMSVLLIGFFALLIALVMTWRIK